MKLSKGFFAGIGFVSTGLGLLGVALPFLPTFPFLLLAAFCFAKSSDRLHDWFINTNLYKKNLEDFVNGKGMTKKTKVTIMVSVTILLSVGFAMMHDVLAGQIVLVIVWLCHFLYFTFGVKTISSTDKA